MPDVFGIVLAGGEGKRLAPLTADRAKPAVPFGGNYRLIDFALSNLVNAGYRQIVVLTQYKSHSLDRHISTTWRLSPLLGNYVAPVPAQMRRGPRWFSGSADAIYQNLNLLYDERPDIVAVFGADHIYRMDPRQMVDQHIESGRRGDRRGAARAAGRGRPVRRHRDGRRRPDDHRLPREAHRRRRPGRRARPGLRLDGQLRLQRRRADRHRHPRRRGRRLQARHGRQHRPDARRAAARRTSTTSRATRSRARARSSAATGATSARSTPSTTRTWTSSRSSPSSTSTTASGRSSRGPIRCRRPSSSSTTRTAGAGMALDSMVCAGVVISGAHRAPLGALARACTCTPTPRSRTRCSCRASTSGATPSCAGRSSTRTCASREGAQVGVDPERRPRALHDLRGRRRGHPQGRDGRRREGRAAHPRVPAGRLRRRRRARRVPGARAARLSRSTSTPGARDRRDGADRPRGVGRAGRRRAASSRRCARCRST